LGILSAQLTPHSSQAGGLKLAAATTTALRHR
jgi:hypothetical protein